MVVDGDPETVSGRIDVGAGSRVNGAVEAVNGTITLTRAEITGSVEGVNGGITLKGSTVGGNVTSVNGDILIGRDAVVRGDIVVHKPKGFSFGKSDPPKVTIEAGATVEGRLVFKREVTLSVDPGAKVAHSEPVER